MGVCTVIIEFALARLHEISAHFRLIVDFKVLNIPDHLSSGPELHDLLLSAVVLINMQFDGAVGIYPS